MRLSSLSSGAAVWRIRTLALLLAALVLVPVWAADSTGPVVTVMTRNLWPGADLDAIFAATDEASFVQATAAIMAQLKASATPARAAAVADEILAAKPDMVSIQEAALWRTGPIMQPPAATVLYDQLDLLMKELEKRDLHYAVIASQILTDVEAPVPTEGVDLRYTDRDVLLARIDWPQARFSIYNAQTQRYEKLLSFGGPLTGQVTVYRGWMTAEVNAAGRRFYFVVTHLETTLPGVPQAEATQVEQGDELVKTLRLLKAPVILAGDFNSNAEPGPEQTGVVQSIVRSGFSDVWKSARPGEPGYTWPLFFGSPQTGAATPNERIDLVFVRGIRPSMFNWNSSVISADLYGTQKAASGVWPSDHAGLVVKLQFD